MQVYSNSIFAMNTRLNYVLPNVDKYFGHQLDFIIESQVNSLEKILSRFNDDSELKKINKLAFQNNSVVSDKLAEVLDICEKYVDKTNGLFDPAYAGIYDLPVLADKTDIKSAIHHENYGWKNVEWDSQEKKILFKNKLVNLDFGSIGKGFALKEIAAVLESKNVSSAFISFGESSIAGIGNHPSGLGWPVSFSSDNNDSPIRYLLNNDFISISGMHITQKGERPHIYHPIKQKIINAKRLVMVKSTCPVESEVLSTSLYLADANEISLLKNRFGNSEWLIKDY